MLDFAYCTLHTAQCILLVSSFYYRCQVDCSYPLPRPNIFNIKMQRKSTRLSCRVLERPEPVATEMPAKRPRNSYTQIKPKDAVNDAEKTPVIKHEESSKEFLPSPGNNYVSAYEATIQKNIKERMEMLKMLQIDSIKEEVKAVATIKKPTKVYKKSPKPTKPLNLTPSRRSLRISGKAPSGELLPPRPTSPVRQLRPRKLGRQTILEASDYEEPEDLVEFMEKLRKDLAKQERRQDIPEDNYTTALTGMRLTGVAKVTPMRICSMAFCPLADQLLLAAGDKLGVLGLWDFSRGEDGVRQLDAHTGHINGLSFAPLDGRRCFTTSYDGITRCLDLEKLQFDEVYATDDSSVTWLNTHAHVGAQQLLIGRSDGRLVRADLRGAPPGLLHLSDRGLRYLSVHPANEHCLVAVERPGTVSLWDLRHVKGPRSALQRLELPRAAASAAISGRTGDHVVAPCTDDTIKVYSGVNQGELNLTKTIRHNNQTDGWWLTTLKPQWLPYSDDLFVVGSLAYPRRIEVYDRSGPVYHLLMGEDMETIPCTTICHPTQPAVAGGNSSGRAFLFN